MFHRLEAWSAAHHPKWLVLLRVALGIALSTEGISFLSHSVELGNTISESGIMTSVTWAVLFITWLHLLGGVLIIAGLLTRWAILPQIPVLLGAVFFVNARKGIFAADSEFIFSLLVLLLLIFFFIEGGGPLSLDHYFKKHPK